MTVCWFLRWRLGDVREDLFVMQGWWRCCGLVACAHDTGVDGFLVYDWGKIDSWEDGFVILGMAYCWCGFSGLVACYDDAGVEGVLVYRCVARCDLPDGGLVARFHDTGVKVALVYGWGEVDSRDGIFVIFELTHWWRWRFLVADVEVGARLTWGWFRQWPLDDFSDDASVTWNLTYPWREYWSLLTCR